MAKRDDWKVAYKDLTMGQLLQLLESRWERESFKSIQRQTVLIVLRDNPTAVEKLREKINEAIEEV